jgi:uncharacterized delta-60 repeat protein
LADSFDPNAGSIVRAIVVQADGKILAGGDFITIGGLQRNRIARLESTNGSADAFDPNANGAINAIAVQPDGRILAGGSFDGIGGQTRNRIARLDATTGAADSFDPNVNALVNAIAVQADAKILVGGSFIALTPNGGPQVSRNRIARMETDGRLDQTLDINVLGRYVRAIAIQPDGKILIGGFFGKVLGVTRNNIARLNTDGTLDMAFDPNANDLANDADGPVNAIAVQTDGKILVGGAFTAVGGQTRNRIARLEPRPARPICRSIRMRMVMSCQLPCRRMARSWRQAVSHQLEASNAIASPDWIPGLDWLIRSIPTPTMLSVQSWSSQTAGFWWAEISTEPTALAARHVIVSPGLMPRPGWLIRSIPTQTMVSTPSRCRRMARS